MTGPWPLRTAARALLLAAVVALAADVALALLTEAVTVASPASAGPWWVAGHVVERSRWIAFALLPLALGRRLAIAAPGEAPAVWRTVGVAVLVVPLVWIAATWLVQAALYTVAGRWDLDGRIFLAAEYYRRILTGYVPWLAGGAATVVVSRHIV